MGDFDPSHTCPTIPESAPHPLRRSDPATPVRSAFSAAMLAPAARSGLVKALVPRLVAPAIVACGLPQSTSLGCIPRSWAGGLSWMPQAVSNLSGRVGAKRMLRPYALPGIMRPLAQALPLPHQVGCTLPSL